MSYNTKFIVNPIPKSNNDVIAMSLKNDFNFDPIWHFLTQSYTPLYKKKLKEKYGKTYDVEGRWKENSTLYRTYDWILMRFEKNEKELVGFCIWNYPKHQKKCNLEFIFISPEYRGQGLGKQLINEFRNLSYNHFKMLECKVEVEPKLIKFYEKLGWKEDKSDFLDFYGIKIPKSFALKFEKIIDMYLDLSISP